MPKTVMVMSSIDDKLKKKLPDSRNVRKEIAKKKTSNIIATKDTPSRKKRAARRILQDFADSSSVHGLKYLISRTFNTSCLGRSLWICTMIAVIMGSIFNLICDTLHSTVGWLDIMLRKFWNNIKESPEQLFLETMHAPVFLAAFPAVTICPTLPTTVKRRYEILTSIKLPANISEEEALVFFKHGSDIISNEEYVAKFGVILKDNQWRLIDFLRLLKPCEDLLDSCWWHGRRINCTNHIKQSHTYGGICCSFNYHLEDLIKYKIRFHKIPTIHTTRTGTKSGLSLIFSRDLFAEDNSTGDINANFVNSIKLLIFVHHTASYPNAETVAYSLQQGQGLRLGVQPTLTKIPTNIHHDYFNGTLQPACIPNSRKSKLRFFPEYRHSNCFTNCKIMNLIKTCGCIRYIYAPMADYSQVPLCDISDLKCVSNFTKYRPMVDYKNCYCTHACEELTYKSMATKYSLETSSLFVLSPIYKGLSTQQAVLNVYLKMDVFSIYRTESSFVYWNILADVGGIFSLCLGCSIISAVEIAYFIYLLCRAICNKKR